MRVVYKNIILLQLLILSLSELFSQDIAGNYHLSGVNARYTYIAREDIPFIVYAQNNPVISYTVKTISRGELISEQDMQLNDVALSAIGINLNVVFNEDGTGEIANGSYYPAINTIEDENENCVTLQQVLPVTDSFTYTSDMNANLIQPGLNPIGMPTISNYSDQTSFGSIAFNSAQTFGNYPATPIHPSVCDFEGNCFDVNLGDVDGDGEVEEGTEYFEGGSPLPGFYGAYYLLEGVNIYNMTSMFSGNIDPYLYMEMHTIDGITSGSGFGDDSGFDEDSDGTQFDRIIGIPSMMATYMSPSCGFNYPIFGDVSSELESMGLGHCIDHIGYANTGYILDNSGALSQWGNFLTWNSVNGINSNDSATGKIVMELPSLCAPVIRATETIMEFQCYTCSSGENCNYYSLGDYNFDTAANTLDLVNLMNCVMADNCDSLYNGCGGDVNVDGGFNILDVIVYANNILLEGWELEISCDTDNGQAGIMDCSGECDGNAEIDECGVCDGNGLPCYYDDAIGFIELFPDGRVEYSIDSDFVGFQFSLEGATIDGAFGGSMENYELNPITNNSTVLSFSLSGNSIPASSGTLLYLDLNYSDPYAFEDIEFNNIVFSDPSGNRIMINASLGCDYIDDCGVCNGDNSSCQDCAGVPYGDAILDNCNICSGGDADHIADSDIDCNGDCFGTAVEDECGVCGGDGIAEGACDCAGNVDDCAGTCAGFFIVDDCDDCVDPRMANNAQDCAGVCDGDAVIEDYYFDGDGDGEGAGESSSYCNATVLEGWVLNSNDTDDACTSNQYQNWYLDSDGDGQGSDEITSGALCTDTTEVEGSVLNSDDPEPDCATNDTDACSVCGGDNSSCADCTGVPNGDATLDHCGICEGDSPTTDPTCDGVDDDCDGEFDEDYVSLDTSCGIGECASTGTTSCSEGSVSDSCSEGTASDDTNCDGLDNDCDGVVDNNNVLDNCDTCDSDSENDCVQDCALVWGGSAVEDCTGICNGGASEDMCNECAGGTTGIDPCTQDCNEEWGGSAVVDECGVCDGGNSSCCLDNSAENYLENGGCEYNFSIDLNEGANLVSFWSLPNDNSLDNMFIDLDGIIASIIGSGTAAQPYGIGWVGSLNEISALSGYWLVLNEPVELDIVTTRLTPMDTTYVLNQGPNLVSWPSKYSCSVDDAIPNEMDSYISGIIGQGMVAIYDEGIHILDMEANTEINGEWIGSLDSLTGGSGYWIYIDHEDPYFEINFQFDCNTLTRTKDEVNLVVVNSDLSLSGYEYQQSTEQAFYFIEDIENIEIGDWILSYNDDVVIGARAWTGDIIDVPAMGDDGSDFTKGYIEAGVAPSFKILRGDELINLEGDIPLWDNNQIYMVSSLREAVALPETFSLDRAYPNPFNPTTTLSFAIPVESEVSLSIYNMQGREVSTLIDGIMDAGYHSVVWDANSYASGVYFVKMMAGEFVNTQKLMLIK